VERRDPPVPVVRADHRVGLDLAELVVGGAPALVGVAARLATAVSGPWKRISANTWASFVPNAVLFLESSPYITVEILDIDGGQIVDH